VIAAAGVVTEALAARIDDPATVDALAANRKEAAERGVSAHRRSSVTLGLSHYLKSTRLKSWSPTSVRSSS